jgi:translocator protein
MDWVLFATYFAACAAAATTGALIQPGPWYDALRKPWWTPPPIVFPLVWTTLYILMSWSAARVAALPGSGQAMAFWAVQIALNTLWTPVFFGLKRMQAGFVVILCLWAAVAATTVSFWAIDPVAGAMFAPYLLWVTIAGALNFTVWRLNPDASA